MKKEYCMTCDNIVTPVLSTRSETRRFKGEDFIILAHVANCPTCGEEFLTPESHDINLQTLQTIYRMNHGLLKAEDIKRIRRKYGLSQAKFAKVLGLGDKTVTRYENGYVPDLAQNNLILLADEPINMKRLFENKRDFLGFEQGDSDILLQKIQALMQVHMQECIVVEAPITWTENASQMKPDPHIQPFWKNQSKEEFRVCQQA